MAKNIKRLESNKPGSALIMTVVLTVLLSIVAVMFVAVARMDMASTGNIADNKALESSAKSIIELINRQLVLDTPGVAGQEYYDYPGDNDTWLASIEPYLYSDSGTPADTNDDIYKWRQISDVTNYLHGRYPTTDVNTDPCGSSKVIKDYPDMTLSNGQLKELWADADGDGIADSKWFELANMRSSKGKPIYAAVRIIDNSGMININTAYRFDANSTDANKIDGSGQMQINLKGLLKGTPAEIDTQITALNTARGGLLADYERNVIWRYVPNGNYLPFDISDELELRYRYCIDSRFISRFEVNCPQTAKGAGTANFGHLYDASTEAGQSNNPCASNWRLSDWQRRITEFDDCKADRRHLLTSLNFDRIIDPCGVKMTNINTADVNDIYNNLFTKIGFNSGLSAQIAVNIIDYRDSDSNVTDFTVGATHYYGFETPCIYISELAVRQVTDPLPPNTVHKSYAIELYRPYLDEPNGWKLISDAGWTYDINWLGTKYFYVITWENPSALLDVNISDANVQMIGDPGSNTIFGIGGSTIWLTRKVNGNNITIDSIPVPSSWPPVSDGNYSLSRDITQHKCIRRLESGVIINSPTDPTLGRMNNYVSPDANTIQAYPKNSPFTNIGELGMIFRKAAYYPVGPIPPDTIGYNGLDKEYQVRLNLADPNFQQIFKYLTVIDPNNYIADANETRVKGRININTAPAYVLAQLPWVSLRNNPVGYNDPNLAKAIIAYRDKTKIPCGEPNDYGTRPDPCGFRSIGELCDVNLGSDPNFGIDYYKRDGLEQAGFPDLDPNVDGAIDDFEERDLIFARISNLVTVRSDIFTAYILVRIGTDGPQKRCITILDRSRVKDINDRVYIRAFQTTPEAR